MLKFEWAQTCRPIWHASDKIECHGHNLSPVASALCASCYDLVKGAVHPLYHPIALRMVGGRLFPYSSSTF